MRWQNKLINCRKCSIKCQIMKSHRTKCVYRISTGQASSEETSLSHQSQSHISQSYSSPNHQHFNGDKSATTRSNLKAQSSSSLDTEQKYFEGFRAKNCLNKSNQNVSLYSLYHAETCKSSWRYSISASLRLVPFGQHSSFRRNVAAVVSCWQKCIQ